MSLVGKHPSDGYYHVLNHVLRMYVLLCSQTAMSQKLCSPNPPVALVTHHEPGRIKSEWSVTLEHCNTILLFLLIFWDSQSAHHKSGRVESGLAETLGHCVTYFLSTFSAPQLYLQRVDHLWTLNILTSITEPLSADVIQFQIKSQNRSGPRNLKMEVEVK